MFEAPRYTPGAKYQQDVSAASVSEWEKELMEDPKVQQHHYQYGHCL